MVSRLPGLKPLRVFNGLSQEALARAIGITTTAFARYETHGSVPRGEQLASLARVLDCEVWHLFHPAPLDVMGLKVEDPVPTSIPESAIPILERIRARSAARQQGDWSQQRRDDTDEDEEIA